jgi:competence ComEA-like helix-hairpin-helix protein
MADNNTPATQPVIAQKRAWIARTDVMGALCLAVIFIMSVTVIVIQQSRAGSDIEILRGEGVSIDARVNLNSAPKGELILLPGIGEKRAQRIVEWREKNGPFSDLEQVRKASGLPAKACLALREMVTFGHVEPEQ